MRIVFATRTAIPYPSAASINTMRMCNGLAQLGHAVTLAVGRKLWRIHSAVHDVWDYYGVQRSFHIQRFWELPRCGLSFDRRIVQLAKDKSALLYLRYPRLLPLAVSAQVPTILELHSALPAMWLRQLSPALASPAVRGIVVITAALRQWLVTSLPQAIPTRIMVAPDAVDTEQFNAGEVGEPASNHVGYAGSLYPGKGMEVIVPLAKRLPDTQFLIFGGKRRGEGLDWPSSDVANLCWLGPFRPGDVPACLHRFGIALLPNQPCVRLPSGIDIGRYTSPMKLFEYMAAGKAIVASDLPNLREVLQDEYNCLLVPHDDVAAWAAAIERLQHDAALRCRLGQQARHDAVESYSYRHRFQRILGTLVPDLVLGHNGND